MEREGKRVDRKETEKRRDSYNERARVQRKIRNIITTALSVFVMKRDDFADGELRHECLWILSALDNRIADLEAKAQRAETLMTMLDAEAQREGIDVLKFTW